MHPLDSKEPERLKGVQEDDGLHCDMDINYTGMSITSWDVVYLENLNQLPPANSCQIGFNDYKPSATTSNLQHTGDHYEHFSGIC